MNTHIFNKEGGFYRSGRDLRTVMYHAKKRKVKSIVMKAEDSKTYAVMVLMEFMDGFSARYNFASVSICKEFHEKRWPNLIKFI